MISRGSCPKLVLFNLIYPYFLSIAIHELLITIYSIALLYDYQDESWFAVPGPCASHALFQVRKIREEMTEKMEERTAQLFFVPPPREAVGVAVWACLQQEIDFN